MLALSLLAPLVTFRDVWLSRFTQIPGDTYDARLNAFFLEHSWGWLIRRPVDGMLWGLPMFFPHGDNALAYSDAELSFGPLYWPWRALGLPPDTSFALWAMTVVAVGVAAGYLLLRRAVGLSPAAAAVGSWLVACSASRLHQISHAQLLPVFFVCAGLGGAIGWARAEGVGRRRAAAALAAAALVAQLYGGFYHGLFIALAVFVLAVLALAMPVTRTEMLRRLRDDWWVLLAIGGATALALWPWASHYRAAQGVVGPRDWDAIVPMVPRPATWIYMTPRALAYHWLRHVEVFRRLPWDFEHAVGLGLLTTTAVLAAAWRAQRRVAVRLVLGTFVAIAAATTMVNGHTFWRVIVDAVPALGAARAVCRVGLLLPIGAAVVLGTWADSLRGRARVAALAVLVACAAEQLSSLDVHDRGVQRHWVNEVARRVDRGAAAFVVSRSSDRGGAMLDPPRRHVRRAGDGRAHGQRGLGQRAPRLVPAAVGAGAQRARGAALPRRAGRVGEERRRRPGARAVDPAAAELPRRRGAAPPAAAPAIAAAQGEFRRSRPSNKAALVAAARVRHSWGFGCHPWGAISMV